MRSTRRRGEQGAMAIFVSLVLLAVAFPLAGLGYSAYVRGATTAELQRSADSGALAGAAAIPLADLSAVNAYLANVGISIPLLPSSPPADPRVIACKQAVRAASVDDGFSQNYADPPPNGTTNPTCEAEYMADGGFVGTLTSCLGQLVSYVPLPLVGFLYANLQGALARTLPALLRPGIQVTLTWSVRGPLDALNPSDDGAASEQTVTSAARRRFKNLVVVPTLPGGNILNPGQSLNLNPAVGALSTLLTSILASLDPLLGIPLNLIGLPACNGLFGELANDLADIINPPDAGAPSVTQVLTAALADAEPVLALRLPSLPLSVLPVLGIAFLDFVPVCVNGSLIGVVQNLSSTVGCMANAPGLFRATLVNT